MKVTFVCLQRIGDFLQQAHIIRSFQSTTKASVQVLGFDELKKMETIFPEMRFVLLDRKDLQLNFADATGVPWRAALLLRQAIQNLGHSQMVFNLTPSQLAARIMELLPADEKRGVQFKDGRAAISAELRELNDNYPLERRPRRAYFPSLAGALAVPMEWSPLIVSEKASATRSEIWVNPFTSDERKSWPLSSWNTLAESLQGEGFEVRWIVAPGEEGRLGSQVPKAKILPLSFSQALEASPRCRLLISGDTSLPHLLSHTETPLLTLYMGFGHPLKNPALNPKAWGLWAPLPCSPCRPRNPCSETRFLCHEALSVPAVSLMTRQLLFHGGSNGLKLPGIEIIPPVLEPVGTHRPARVGSSAGPRGTDSSSAESQNSFRVHQRTGAP